MYVVYMIYLKDGVEKATLPFKPSETEAVKKMVIENGGAHIRVVKRLPKKK